MKENHFQTAGICLLVVVFGVFSSTLSGGAEQEDVTHSAGMPVPVLITFDSAVFQDNNTLTLDWNNVPGAGSYTLEYARNPEFKNPTTIAGITHSQYTFGRAESPAIDGTLSTVRLDASLYYWRVKTVGQNAESRFSPADSFVIESGFPTWTIVLLGAGLAAYMAWQIFV